MKPHSMYNILLCFSACWNSEGGIPRVNRSFVRFFANHSALFKTIILVLNDSPEEISKGMENDIGINDSNILGFSGNKRNFILQYLKYIIQNHFDMIFFSHANLSVLGLIAKLFGMKYAVFLHGIEIWKPLPLHKRLALSKSRFLISNSKFTKTKGSSWHSFIFQANVCHLGIDISNSRACQRQDFDDILQGKRIIFTVGRMSVEEKYSKGYRELIDAMKILVRKLPEVILVLAGNGTLKPVLEKEVERNDLSRNVLFTGYVSDEALSSLYKACQVFAMPSRGEGFGLVYVEAMAHSKPCIGSTVDAAQEIIVNGQTGFLVDLDDAQQLAERIYLLLTNKNLCTQMGKAAFARYHRYFTEEKFHERFLKTLLAGLEC